MLPYKARRAGRLTPRVAALAGDGHRAYIFGIGLGCALLLGFLWTYLLRIPALLSVTIWTMCFAVNAFLVVLGERHAPNPTPTHPDT